jgi:hypothetical protein
VKLAIISLLLCALALVGGPAPAHAYSPVFETQGAASGEKPECNEQTRLAGIVETEAMEQPAEAEIAIAQIVVAEARSRHMTICELSETNFLAVWRWARGHPGGWHAQRFAHVEDWALILAGDALAGTLPDLTRGALHFDGVEHAEPALWQSGQIRFFR